MSNFDDFLNQKKNQPQRPPPPEPPPSALSPVFNPYTPPTSQGIITQVSGQPASFDRRLGAFIIDLIVSNIAGFIVGLVFGFMLVSGGDISGESLESICTLLGIAAGWLYYALQESSAKQATLGKLACGLIVTDMQGQRINFGQATGRHFGKIISGLILCIGFLMCTWTKRKQCLHDIMSGCLVLRK